MTSRLALATTVAAIVLGNTAGASAQTYEITRLVPGSAFHGVHGLGIDKSGRLFAGSVAGAALYEVDRNSGTAKIAVPSPEGMADDIAFAPDGTMAWTGFLTGDLYSRKGNGPPVASDIRAIAPPRPLIMPSSRSRSFSKLASIGPSSERPRGSFTRSGSTKRPLTRIS